MIAVQRLICYFLFRIEIDMSESLKKALDIIIKTAQPEKVILFGSRASGNFTSQSDYDLIILKKGITHTRELAGTIYKNLNNIGAPIDLLVVDYDKFNQLKNDPYLVYYEAEKNGTVIYEQA